MTTEPVLLGGARTAERHSAPRPTAPELIRTTTTAVLLALLLSWMFVAWWTAPRASDVAALDRAVAAGEVTSFVRADRIERSGGSWFATLGPVTDSRGAIIVWQTTSGQTFYAHPGGPPPSELTEPPPSSRDQVDAVEERLRTTGVPHLYRQGSAALLSGLVILGCLLVLVGNPPPRRGTRWFWFWVGGTSAGLGVLAWILLERIWPPPEPRPENRRLHGFAGLGIMILASIAISLGYLALPGWLGSRLIPG